MPRNVSDAEDLIGQFEDEETDYSYDDTFDDEDYYDEDEDLEYDEEELEELDGHLDYVDPADFED